tara:strand:+ start:448 stop:750 length:303 start_codon:yes stop_codon:yes gene_type:complete
MINDDDLLLLQDPQFLMVLVAAIVKKSGGSLSINVGEVEDITSDDALGLFKDADDPETFVLKIVKRSEYLDEIEHTESRKSKTTKVKPRYALYDDEEWEN